LKAVDVAFCNCAIIIILHSLLMFFVNFKSIWR